MTPTPPPLPLDKRLLLLQEKSIQWLSDVRTDISCAVDQDQCGCHRCEKTFSIVTCLPGWID
jgi:hypothetical protein